MYIGEIIKKYRESNNLTQRDFAKRTSLSPSYINTLEKVYNPKNNKPYSVTIDACNELAKAMNINIHDLLDILNENQRFDASFSYKKIPLLNQYKIDLNYSINNYIKKYIYIDGNIDNNCFGLVINDNSMMPILNINDIAIIHSNSIFFSGSTYLIKYNDSYIIRKIIKLPEFYELQAINFHYPTIKTNDIEIVGKVIMSQNQSIYL